MASSTTLSLRISNTTGGSFRATIPPSCDAASDDWYNTALANSIAASFTETGSAKGTVSMSEVNLPLRPVEMPVAPNFLDAAQSDGASTHFNASIRKSEIDAMGSVSWMKHCLIWRFDRPRAEKRMLPIPERMGNTEEEEEGE